MEKPIGSGLTVYELVHICKIRAHLLKCFFFRLIFRKKNTPTIFHTPLFLLSYLPLLSFPSCFSISLLDLRCKWTLNRHRLHVHFFNAIYCYSRFNLRRWCLVVVATIVVVVVDVERCVVFHEIIVLVVILWWLKCCWFRLLVLIWKFLLLFVRGPVR